MREIASSLLLEFIFRHPGSQITPLIRQYNPKPTAPPLHPPPVADCWLLMRQRGALLCSALLCSALLCARKERTRRGESSWERTRKERTGQHNSPTRPILTLCSGGWTKFWSAREEKCRYGPGGEMDLCGSPRGFVCAR